RRGRRWNAAFILGVTGALLVMVGATLPQLILPGYETTPLVTLDSVLALQFDSGAMVIVFALFAIAFALVGRYRWIIFCAIMIITFLTTALLYQLIGITGLSVTTLIDLQNGILPPDMDPRALLNVVPALENWEAEIGLMVVGAGILLLELAPWMKWLRGGGKPIQERAEPHIDEPEPEVRPVVPDDLLVDGIYFFAEGLARPLSFNLMTTTNQLVAMHASLTAAGYLGDTYFVRCRDLDIGNLRDVPAHMMSEIVDVESGERVDTDDFLNDLAQVAYEAIEGVEPEVSEPAVEEIIEQPQENLAPALKVVINEPSPAT
ncbi:MAG: hypothetical protein ACKVH7_10880, partial [Alphaproteobacteria bacterium]